MIDEFLKQAEEASLEQYAFLDIETGAVADPGIVKELTEKVVNDVMTEQYQWRDDWKDETNLRKQQEFESKKTEKAQKKLQEILQKSALNPFINQIVSVAIKVGNKETTFTGFKDEKSIIEFIIAATENKKVVTYTEFDIKSIETKAIKYGLHKKWKSVIDLSKFATYWSPFGKKEILSQDMFAIVLGLKPNEYREQLKAEEIPDIVRNISLDIIPEEQKTEYIDLIKAYNIEDVRVLYDIFRKIYEYGGINE